MCNMPEKDSIKAESITDVYAEVMELNSAIDIAHEGSECITIAFSCLDKSESLGFPLSGIKFDDVTQWVIAYDKSYTPLQGYENGVRV